MAGYERKDNAQWITAANFDQWACSEAKKSSTILEKAYKSATFKFQNVFTIWARWGSDKNSMKRDTKNDNLTNFAVLWIFSLLGFR